LQHNYCTTICNINIKSSLRVSFTSDAAVTPSVWSELDLLQSASGWSKLTSTTYSTTTATDATNSAAASAAATDDASSGSAGAGVDARTAKYNELLQLHKDWPERVTVLQSAYAKFVSHDAAAAAASAEVTATS
jgi:hypothetical protein